MRVRKPAPMNGDGVYRCWPYPAIGKSTALPPAPSQRCSWFMPLACPSTWERTENHRRGRTKNLDRQESPPDAHEVIVNWSHQYLKEEAEAGRIDQRTVITVLTHDPKFDVPVLVEALKLDLAYLGAMGSPRTHKDREARLPEAGVTDEERP